MVVCSAMNLAVVTLLVCCFCARICDSVAENRNHYSADDLELKRSLNEKDRNTEVRSPVFQQDVTNSLKDKKRNQHSGPKDVQKLKDNKRLYQRRSIRSGQGNCTCGSEPCRLGTIYSGTVQKHVKCLYSFHVWLNESNAVRIHVSSQKATGDNPVLFVVEQQRSILSWQVPLFIENLYDYNTVSRTLCPDNNYTAVTSGSQFGRRSFPAQTMDTADIIVDISSFSLEPMDFIMNASRVENFVIGTGVQTVVHVQPSEPKYYQYNFPEGEDSVVVKATSEDDLCMVLSVQQLHCPVFDLDRNVEFTGEYQTMTKKAAVTVQKSQFPDGADSAFYIVMVIKPNDYECTGIEKIREASSVAASRLKSITITVELATSEDQYLVAIITAVGFYGLFYLASLLISIAAYVCDKHSGDTSIEEETINQMPHQDSPSDPHAPINNAGESTRSYGATPSTGVTSRQLHNHAGDATAAQADNDSDDSLDESSIDMLRDADLEKDVYRTKTFIYVADLSRKNNLSLAKKFRLYHWNLITIAIFYGLPVIQLVVTYQTVLHVTGNEDICYYNFFCAQPLGVVSAFNNIFSNIGYISLGILFLLLTWRRNVLYKKECEANCELEKKYGIPQHFGLFYAMGIGLMMEGVMSGCYHVCPSYSNFQFDTSFMYVTAVICMLKIYQTRHPDISASAYSAYGSLAFVIFIAVIGVVYGNLLFWVIYTVVHVVICLVLSAQIYYMGRWSLDVGIFKRIWNVMRTDGVQCARPMYLTRMVLLVIGNVINWSLALYGGITQPRDFASYLLAVFLMNLLLYTAFYIVMKLRHGERILLLPCLYILLAVITWAFALYFFMAGLTSWQLTPAMSREGNKECMLLDFYDSHDVWHFLSAAGIFFSFMILMTLDDDLRRKPRDKIPVF